MPRSRVEIWKMFDHISTSYDRVNRVMTFWLDLYWRKQATRAIAQKEHLSLLDLATGTGDQLLSVLRHHPTIETAVGIDLSSQMLKKAEQKLARTRYANRVKLIEASALKLPFPDHSFDCATMSFGIRNVTDVSLCLQEIYRVLKIGGKVILLEASLPHSRLLRSLHLLYLRHVMPSIGRLFSRNKEAYRYLNQTIETFPSGPAFCSLLEAGGFKNPQATPLTGGLVSLYTGEKL